MALVSLNTINIDKGVSDDFYSEIILYPLMTDSGPNGYTLVSTLDDLRTRFSPSIITSNWYYAETLLSAGYRLLIAKLTTVEHYLSLRIFESYEVKKEKDVYYKEVSLEPDKYTGLIPQKLIKVVNKEDIYTVPTTFSHPKRGVDYKKISLPWEGIDRGSVVLPKNFTYSIKLPIPEKFNVGDYIFFTQKQDNDLVTTGQVHRFIGFGNKNNFSDIISSEVATDIKYIELTKDHKDIPTDEVINILIDTLNHFGLYNINLESKDENYLYFSSMFPIQYNTTCRYTEIIDGKPEPSFKYILNYSAGNFDIICEAADEHKLVDFYSKESLSKDNITLDIIKNFDGNFTMFINVVNDNGSSSKSESFRFSMSKDSKIFIEKVLQSSEIIDCVWYKEGDISGKFTLRSREEDNDISLGGMLDVFNSLPKLDDGDFDIIVDAGLPEFFQKSLYDKYKDYMCVKLFQLKTQKEILDKDGNLIDLELFIPEHRKKGVLYTNKFLNIKGFTYPLWMGILILFKSNKRFFGDINVAFSFNPTFIDYNGEVKDCKVDENDSYLCSLIFDNYRYIIPSKPIYMGESTYSLDLIWCLTLIRNRIIPSINPNLSQDDFIRKFNSLVRELLNNKENRISSVVITGYKKTDKKLSLEILVLHDSEFIDSVSLEITIKIR